MPVNSLRDLILRGLRERTTIARNAPGLVLLRNARVIEDGIRPYPVIATEANIEALNELWPFPQVFRYPDRTILTQNLTPFIPADVTEGSPWTLVNIAIVDKWGNPITPLASGAPWHVANFGAFTVMTNGDRVLFNKSGASNFQTQSMKVASVCNYKDGQLVMGGLGGGSGPGPGVFWHPTYLDFVKYRQAFDPNWPLPGNALATELVSVLPNHVWWSSVSGGDAFLHMDPHELLLPAYSDVTLDDELFVNGTFDVDTTGWILGAGWARTGNAIVATGAAGEFGTNNATAYTRFPLNQRYYLLTFTWTATSGSCYIQTGNAVAGDWQSEILPAGVGPVTITRPILFNGDPTELVTAADTRFIPLDAGFSGTIDNISMKEIVKHKLDYNENLPTFLNEGLMQDVDRAIIETAWGAADGVSTFSAVPRFSNISNGNMHAGPDALDPNDRSKKMFEKSNWIGALTDPTDYLTHGLTHVDEVNPMLQSSVFNFLSFDDDAFYEVQIYIVGRTVGSVDVQFGAGTGFDGRKNATGAIIENGWTRIGRIQRDTNAGTLADYVRVVPTDDFDGTVTAVHVEDEDLAIQDAFSLESHTNHTDVTQVAANMNSTPITGNRYRVNWRQATYVPSNICRDGIPIFEWDQVDTLIRPVNAPLYWDAEDGASDWWTTSERNILSSSLFYNSQVNGWVQGGGWAYDAGNDEMDQAVPNLEDQLVLPTASHFAAAVHGRTYDIFIEIRNRTVGQVWVRLGTNSVGGNQLLVPAGNGYFTGTITADNAATDWQDFVIASDATFDGSIGEVMCMDRTRSVDPWAGSFELYSLAATTDQAEVNMHCYPLVEGETYRITWTIQDLIGAHTVRVLIGGTTSPNRSAPGTFIEDLVCGATSDFVLQGQGTAGSVRVVINSILPMFTDGVRPILATETQDVDGVSTYFRNSEDRLYESFTRDIEVPAAPGNFNLGFEFEHRTFPVRISAVELIPLDSETAIVDMQPKPKIYDYFERNESGLVPIPFPGEVRRVLQLGDHIMVYGTNNVCYLETHGEPIHAKVARRLDKYPRTMGIASEGACNGDVDEQIWVDEKGMLWRASRGAIPQVTKLDYQEFFAPMLGNDIQITRDQQTQAWRISDGVVGYYWRDGKLSATPDATSFLEFESGGLVGHTVDFAIGDPEFELLTNAFGVAGDRMAMNELYQVKIVGRGQAGAYGLGPELILTNRQFDADLTDWTVLVDDWAWQAGGFARCNANDAGDILRHDIFRAVAGRDYQTRLVIGGAPGGGSVKLNLSTVDGTPRSTAGTFIETLTANAANLAELHPQVTLVTDIDVDEISIRELRGFTSSIPIEIPFAICVDAKLHEGDIWTRFGPFWPDSNGVAITKVLGVEFRIHAASGNSDLAELDDILYDIREGGKRSLGKWVSAVT